MTFVTRQETTWGDLREGERIVDKNDVTWTLHEPKRIGAEVRVAIYSAVSPVTIVVKPATQGVTVIREAPLIEAPIGLITREQLADNWNDPGLEKDRTWSVDHDEPGARQSALEVSGNIDPEILDAEMEKARATVEEKLGPTTEILPVIDTALELRSHLYLLHGVLIHEATTRAALLEHHRRSHLLEAEGNGEAGATPHVHEEETT